MEKYRIEKGEKDFLVIEGKSSQLFHGTLKECKLFLRDLYIMEGQITNTIQNLTK